MKKNIVTIAGSLGSGKSSTAKAVAASLNFKHFSSGDLFRKIAAEHGVSIEAINLTAEAQQEIDHQVDQLLREMYENDDMLVIDSRMAWHWMPESFKVYLTLDLHKAAARIFAHMQSEGRVSESAASVEEVYGSLERRFASEQKRYMTLYGVDNTNPANYDLVINTADYNLEEVIAMVLKAYTARNAT